MPTPSLITLTLDRSLLEHRRALHIRRMRTAFFLYVDLLARLPAGADTIEVKPSVLAEAMGLPEGTVRSWLGHLRRAGYIGLQRMNGSVLVTLKQPTPTPERLAASIDEVSPRSFTVGRIQRALSESGSDEQIAAALSTHADLVIQRALAGALAPPSREIRRSRTALFLFLVNKHSHATENDPRH
jgi:hypothetical protein